MTVEREPKFSWTKDRATLPNRDCSILARRYSAPILAKLQSFGVPGNKFRRRKDDWLDATSFETPCFGFIIFRLLFFVIAVTTGKRREKFSNKQ